MPHRRRLAIYQAAKRASFTGKPVAPNYTCSRLNKTEGMMLTPHDISKVV